MAILPFLIFVIIVVSYCFVKYISALDIDISLSLLYRLDIKFIKRQDICYFSANKRITFFTLAHTIETQRLECSCGKNQIVVENLFCDNHLL